MTNLKNILIFILIVAGPSAGADVTAKTDFYFPVKMEDYTQILLSNPLEGLEKTNLPRFSFEKPFKTTIYNTVMDISYTAKVKELVDKSGSFSFELDITNSHLLADRVITDDVVEKYVGGIYIKVYLKGECTDVGFHSATPSSLSGVFELVSENSQLAAKIQSLQIKGLGDWKITVGACDGPKGFQKALEAELKQFLKDKVTLEKLFKDQLQKKLDSVVAEMTAKVMTVRQIEVNKTMTITLQPQNIYLNSASGQILIHGDMVSYIKSKHTEQIEVPSEWTPQDESQFSQSGFIISQDYIAALSQAFFKSGFYSFNFFSDAVTGLKDLFKSRLYQFFLWPDLMKFKRGSRFNFTTYTPVLPKISPLGEKNGFVWFKINGNIQADMQAPVDGKYIPYMNFSAKTDVKTWLGVYKEKALIGFHDPQMDAKKFWDEEYVKKYRPTKSMSLNFFVNKIKDLVDDKRFLFDLPSVEVGESKILKPSKFSSDKKWIQLIYEPTTDSSF